jgi:8-oxo-dGTP pyrophosphatase MutT (NUDIX family)
MKLLTEIFHHQGLNLISGSVVTRNAVRAIIFDQDQLFMIYSKKNGDYKFPGGGLKKGEDHRTALIREIKEESGVENVIIEKAFGKVIEYDLPIEEEYDLFKMTSRYFLCNIGSVFGIQRLDPYEIDLGFTACWVSIDQALNTNRALLREKYSEMPRWVQRETFVLEKLKNWSYAVD